MTGRIICGAKDHSRFGASAAHRWTVCTGSVRACRDLPDTTSRAAEEGTAAHAVAEHCLKSGQDAEALRDWVVEVSGGEYTVDEDMIEGVQLFLDVVRTDRDLLQAALLSEQTFHLPEVHADAYGSADAVVLQPMGRLIVYDFKYGRTPVEAENNDQMKFYGLGALKRPEAFVAEEVELVIVQPRVKYGDTVKRWLTTPEAVAAFAGHLKAKAEEAEAGGKLVTGDHCKYCKYEASCPARSGEAMTAVFGFSPLDDATRQVPAPPAPSYLSREQIEKILALSPMITGWLDAVEQAARMQLERGDSNAPTTFKLVEGKKTRKWTDEKFVVDSGLSDDIIWERSIRSPAQMEKALKAAKVKFDIKPLLTETRGVSMVPSTDPRPAIPRVAAFRPIPQTDQSFLE